MNVKDMPVLVTGGTGLVGSHLIYRLVSEGWQVRAIHRKTSNLDFLSKVASYYTDDPEKIMKPVEWTLCDILDYDGLADTLKGCGHVYHCAAAVSFESGHSDLLLDNNIRGTANLVRACMASGITRLCHVSSTAALGAPHTGKPVNEEHIWKDDEYHAVYAISKYRSENEVWEGIRQGLDAIIVNPSVIFGPGDWKKGSSSFFSNIDSGMLFYTDGVTGYVDVNDVADVMVKLMSLPVSGERFIVSSENLSFRQVFSMIARSLGVREPFLYVPAPVSWPVFYLTRLFALLTGRKSPLTKETVKAAYSKVLFDNSKVVRTTGIGFRPMEVSVSETARLYLKDKSAGIMD